jgi:glycosyltransferase involved in cell wall biosynthesis
MDIVFVIATKDRPDDLRKVLRSLAEQPGRPPGVIIVDGGSHPVRPVVAEFASQLRLTYIHHAPPSAAAQRNAGIRALPSEARLIGFIDDDAALEPFALERMMTFWENAAPDIGGCAFNLVNHPPVRGGLLKRSRVAEILGLYSAKPGVVMPSGWQTMIGTVRENIFVDWLPSTAVVWRAEVLESARFDEFFIGYSYLEDLDLSFTVRRTWRLAVLAEAGYTHNPSSVRHMDGFSFGRREILNRLHFVRKHGLSVPRCCLAIAGRFGMTLGHAARHLDGDSLRRAAGNLSVLKAAAGS